MPCVSSVSLRTSKSRRKYGSGPPHVADSTRLRSRGRCSRASTWPMAPPVEWPTRWAPRASLSGTPLAPGHRMRLVQQTFRFLSLVLGGLVLSLAVAHALEMPAKLALSPSDYLIVQRIYGAFGAVGALIEPGAVVAAIGLAFLARHSRAVRPALAGALCFVAALLIWVAIVNPVNAHWDAAGSLTVPQH